MDKEKGIDREGRTGHGRWKERTGQRRELKRSEGQEAGGGEEKRTRRLE